MDYKTGKCDLVFSESGLAELDCIFATHFPGDEKDIWVVDCYQPTEMIQFIRVAENRVIRYRISLKDNAHGQTIALWEQIVTGFNRDRQPLCRKPFKFRIWDKNKGVGKHDQLLSGNRRDVNSNQITIK